MAKSHKPRKHRVAPPKHMNGDHAGEANSVDVLSPEEFRAFKRQLVNDMVKGINTVFNENTARVGVSIMLWDADQPSGGITYGSNQPREVALQVWTAFRERSERDESSDRVSE